MTDETKPNPERPRPIEPGMVFDVKYGSGHVTDVVALSVRKQREASNMIREILLAEQSGDNIKALDLFDVAENVLRIVKPNVSDEFLDTLDALMCVEIASNAIGLQALTDDDKKKFASQR